MEFHNLEPQSDVYFVFVLAAIFGAVLMQGINSFMYFSVRKTGNREKRKKMKEFLRKVESGEIDIG